MSHENIIQMALKRREVFNNLKQYLQMIKKTVQEIDRSAEIYLFGSVPDKNYTHSSDIDVLIITKTDPDLMRLKLWQANIKDPFEFHIHTPEKAKRIRAKLYKVE